MYNDFLRGIFIAVKSYTNGSIVYRMNEIVNNVFFTKKQHLSDIFAQLVSFYPNKIILLLLKSIQQTLS